MKGAEEFKENLAKVMNGMRLHQNLIHLKRVVLRNKKGSKFSKRKRF